MSKKLTRWRTYSMPGDAGPAQATHLEGIGDSYTLCGTDTAGDKATHRRPPEIAREGSRITCPHCKEIIALVKQYLGESPTPNRPPGQKQEPL